MFKKLFFHLVGFCLFLYVSLFVPAAVQAAPMPVFSSPLSPPFQNIGEVSSVAVDASGTSYVSGSFRTIGARPIGYGFALDPTTGVVPSSYPQISDSSPSPGSGVFTSVSDGNGGWFVGGKFDKVDSATSSKLIHILPDGTWDPSFYFYIKPGSVRALAVSGTTLYVGGDFGSFGGPLVFRNNIAAIDIPSKTVLSWDPDIDDIVDTIQISGSTIYVGGNFSSIGPSLRNHIGAIDATTGLATSWNPDADARVRTLFIQGSRLYAGGDFTTIGGSARTYLASFSLPSDSADAWDPGPDGTVFSISASGTTVYIGGGFGTIGGSSRNALAAVNSLTGIATSWNPDPDSEVYALAVDATNVYVGGAFTYIGGAYRGEYFAGIDALSGSATSWNPRITAGNFVRSVSFDGTHVFIGGDFTHADGYARKYLAAIDRDGHVLDWNPGMDNPAQTMLVTSSTLYLGGAFSQVAGVERHGVAAIDLVTASATSWNPNIDGTVFSLAASDQSMYVGGSFTMVGGDLRNNIAEIDLSTASATAWDPNSDGQVSALVLADDGLYVGGSYLTIGGFLRRNIAKLDLATGAALSWYPASGADNSVATLALDGSSLYVGGYFQNIGEQPRNYIASIDAVTGLTTDWDPSADDWVQKIVPVGSEIYLGGNFSTIGGQSRRALADVSATSGLASAWDPGITNGFTSAISVLNDRLFVGGSELLFSADPNAIGYGVYEIDQLFQNVFVTGSVAPLLSFSVRDASNTVETNSCDLGTLSAAVTSTCSYRLRIETNASYGFSLSLQADHSFRTPAYATMTDVGDNLPLGAGNEAYGIMVSGASLGGLNPGTPHLFDQPIQVSGILGTTFDTSVSPVPTSSTVLLDSSSVFSATSTAATTLVTHFATISSATIAGQYSQTVTYLVTARF